jgi:hypothetical protein
MVAMKSTSERGKPKSKTLRRMEMEKSVGEQIFLK